MSREKRSFAQEVCVKSAGKAMQKTGMLWAGCRVGVAVSGGADSFVLLKSLKIRQGIVPFRFELMALHLNPGFEPRSHAGRAPIRKKICATRSASVAPGCGVSACSSSARVMA